MFLSRNQIDEVVCMRRNQFFRSSFLFLQLDQLSAEPQDIVILNGSGVDIGYTELLTVLVELVQRLVVSQAFLRISNENVIVDRFVPLLKFVLTSVFSVDCPNQFDTFVFDAQELRHLSDGQVIVCFHEVDDH